MSADDFNKRQIESGELSPAMVTRLVRHWQRDNDLVVDGYAGRNTVDSLRPTTVALAKFWPLRCLADGRKPIITSGFYSDNPSRPTHRGVDMFFRWLDSDPNVPVGDGGAIRRKGKRRWWIPPNTFAVAAAAGIVQRAGDTRTGFRVWVDHGNGERTGYFHGWALAGGLTVGSVVEAGQPLITVGDNPRGHDATHLHFEVSPVGRYDPANPRKWLEGATFL
jgi:hypothetical protein